MSAGTLGAVALVISLMSLALGVVNYLQNKIYSQLVEDTARRLGELDES